MSKIYVGNLPFQATPEALTEVFQKFGEIKELAFIKDRYTEEFRGFVFITFVSPQSAEEALSMDGQDFMGRPMKVNMAREEGRRSDWGGGGGRGERHGGGGGRGGRSGGGRSGGGGGGYGNKKRGW